MYALNKYKDNLYIYISIVQYYDHPIFYKRNPQNRITLKYLSKLPALHYFFVF